MIKSIWFEYGEECPDGDKIRTDVFVDEQKYPLSDEFDEYDKTCRHLVIYKDDVPAATARIFILDDGITAKLGRLSVEKQFRGQHFGEMLMTELKAAAVKMGAEKMFVSAQTYAVPFYSKYGLTAYGKEYLDIHLPHMDMKGDL